MPTTQRRYPLDEFARRGDAVYDQQIAPRLRFYPICRAIPPPG